MDIVSQVLADRTPAFVVFWTVLYFVVRRLTARHPPEWACRLVTLVHALAVIGLCIASTLVVGPWAFDGIGDENTPLQTLCIQICLGYFIFDFVWCLVYQPDDHVMLLHHVTSASGLLYSLITGYSGCELVATIGGAEVTNPLLQARWFLKQTEQAHSTRGFIVDLLFTITFGLFRVGFGTPLLYATYMTEHEHWFMKFGATVLYLVSIVWYYAILKMFYRHHIAPKKTSKFKQ